jgi:hypothetical protein
MLGTTSEMVVVSVPSRRVGAVELAPIVAEESVSAPSPDRIDIGLVNVVHGVANAAAFESYRLLDGGSLELISRIDFSAVPGRFRRKPIRCMTGDGSAILVSARVMEKDWGRTEYYALDRLHGSVPRHVDAILRPAKGSAGIALRTLPGGGKHLLARGAAHELSHPVSIGIRALD